MMYCCNERKLADAAGKLSRRRLGSIELGLNSAELGSRATNTCFCFCPTLAFSRFCAKIFTRSKETLPSVWLMMRVPYSHRH